MNYIVWGCGVRGIWLKKQIENAGMEVAAFADNDLRKVGRYIENIPVISIWRLKKEFVSGRVVIPGTLREVEVKRIVEQVSDVVSKEDIYVVPCNILLNRKETEAVKNILIPLTKWIQIDNLGIKLSRHCNLNCIRCNNFSNISEEGYYYSEELDRDLKRLSSLVPNVFNIELIGGEPLLNPELTECVRIVRKYYPYSNCQIVTNGLLLKNLDRNILDCFKENDVIVTMTLYPAMWDSVDEIAERLAENEVAFNIYRSGEYFIPILNEEGRNDPTYVKKRTSNKCVSFYKGNISRCTPIMNIAAYNQKFYKNFPEGGKINIYEENLTGEELVHRLDEPIELCRYCNGCLTLDEKEYGKKWALGKAQYEDWLMK